MFVTLLAHCNTTEQRNSGMESLKGISALPWELVRTYDVYLLALTMSLLTQKGITISFLRKLDKKEQGFGVYSQAYLGDHFMTFCKSHCFMTFPKLVQCS